MIRSDTRHLDRRRRHQGRASCEVTGRRFEVQGSAQGLYTNEAVKERRLLRELFRQSRMALAALPGEGDP